MYENRSNPKQNEFGESGKPNTLGYENQPDPNQNGSRKHATPKIFRFDTQPNLRLYNQNI